MTFPVLEDIATADAGGTSQTITFSAIGLTVNSGERLVCIASHDGTPTVTLDTSGFTEHLNAANSTHNYGMWSKIAAGTETMMDFSLSASEDGAYILFTVSGDNAFEFSSVATGTNNSPNPPSFTPSYGSGDHLWAAVEFNDRARSVTAYPTDYADNQTNQVTGGTAGAAVGIAFRSVAAASQDPGTFTLNNSDEWVGLTLCFEGTGGGGGGLSIPVAQHAYRRLR